MRDVVAVRAEGDQILQLCFLWLLALAQGVEVVGLDDFPVIVEAAGDAGEAVAFLGLENQQSAPAQAEAGDGLPLTFQFGGGFLLADLHRHGGRPLIPLGLLVDPQGLHVVHVEEPAALAARIGGDSIRVAELFADAADLGFPVGDGLSFDHMGEYGNDPVLVVLGNNGLVAIRFRQMQEDVVGGAFVPGEKFRLGGDLSVDPLVGQCLDPIPRVRRGLDGGIVRQRLENPADGEQFVILVRQIPHAGVGDAVVSREIHLPPRHQLPIRKPAQRVGSLLRAGDVACGHRIEVFQIGEQAPRVGARILELLLRLLIEGRVGCIEGFHEPLPDLLEAARKIKRLLANRDVAPAFHDDTLQELFKRPVGKVVLPVHGRKIDMDSDGLGSLTISWMRAAVWRQGMKDAESVKSRIYRKVVWQERSSFQILFRQFDGATLFR